MLVAFALAACMTSGDNIVSNAASRNSNFLRLSGFGLRRYWVKVVADASTRGYWYF